MQANAASISVTEVGDAFNTSTVEFRGVSAGEFNSRQWKENHLHFVPDLKSPLIAPQEGNCRNIYAPSAVETGNGWTLFYGGWDGASTCNDRIYATNTSDFLSFTPRRTIIDNGPFQHVCNVNASISPAGNYDLICTVYPDSHDRNKPALFQLPLDFMDNHKTVTPDFTDIVQIDGYDYKNADINGMSVMLHDNGKRHLYFGDFKNFNVVRRASSTNDTTFTLDGDCLRERVAVNDVKRFNSKDGPIYLMGLHMNTGWIKYSLSDDGLEFQPSQKLFDYGSEAERYIVAVGWVTQGPPNARKLLGVLYGAGPVPSLDQNRIFVRWLQKRIVLLTPHVNSDATVDVVEDHPTEAPLAHGPDRVIFAHDQPKTMSIRLYDESGMHVIGESALIHLRPGKAYQITF